MIRVRRPTLSGDAALPGGFDSSAGHRDVQLEARARKNFERKTCIRAGRAMGALSGRSVVNIFPMSDFTNIYYSDRVVNGVDDPIIPDTDTPGVVLAF